MYIESQWSLGIGQAGFRKNYNTTYHIFILKSIVDIYILYNIHNKKKMFCTFVDYKTMVKFIG